MKQSGGRLVAVGKPLLLMAAAASLILSTADAIVNPAGAEPVYLGPPPPPPERLHRKVNVNTATRKELESLPGIGPAKAARILAWRHKLGGSFPRLRDIRRAKGVGRKTLDKLRPFLTLDENHPQTRPSHPASRRVPPAP